MKQSIEDYFDDGQEFEDALLSAVGDAEGRDLDFLIDLKDKWEKYGMRASLSLNQYNWLARLADLPEL